MNKQNSSNKRYVIGMDFGTLTARGVLVDVSDGTEIAVSIQGYQDAVIDTMLPESGQPLPPEFALQNPQDYEDALEGILKDLWRKAGIDPRQIIGIGIDFTSCTMLPLDRDLVPLCYDPKYRENPHSWPKLWKHHAAQKEADTINRLAHERDESFIKRYGNASSCEWMFAKILEILNKSPEIYDATYRFVEAADWVVYLLTGNLKKSIVTAGFKAFWDKKSGYPSSDFFAALHPAMEHVIEEKIGTEVCDFSSPAGHLTERMAAATGLSTSTMVSVGNIDAHISFPAAGASKNSTMLMIMGTSLCHIMVSSQEILIDGISGVTRDGVLPGFYGYEAGQAAVGDIYNWFVSNAVPDEYLEEVKLRNIDIYSLMNEKMARLVPGASGLLALDWWNGNRSLLVNSDLSGMLLGLTLSTTAEDIYRALVEATAFGSRMIIEAFEQNGVPVSQIFACGGLAFKAPQIMQIFADIIGKPIKISDIKQTSALGAAMYGAVAAGKGNGGYDTIFEAARHMTKPPHVVYEPNKEYRETYDRLYEEYRKLHDYFGKGENPVMQNLRQIKSSCCKK